MYAYEQVIGSAAAGIPATAGLAQSLPKQPITARLAEAIKRATEMANHVENIADGIVGTAPILAELGQASPGESNQRPLTAEVDTLLAVLARAERHLSRISSAL